MDPRDKGYIWSLGIIMLGIVATFAIVSFAPNDDGSLYCAKVATPNAFCMELAKRPIIIQKKDDK